MDSKKIAGVVSNIGFVVYADLRYTNGYTNRLLRVLDILKGTIKPVIISSSDPGPNKFDEFEGNKGKPLGSWLLKYRSTRFPFKFYYVLCWNIKLAVTLLFNKFEVVFSVYDPLSFGVIWFFSKLKKYKIVFEMHSIHSEDHIEIGHKGVLLKMDRLLEQFVARHSDFIIALSKNIFDFYYPYNSKMELVPVFIDTSVFKPRSDGSQSNSKSIGLIGPFGTMDLRRNHCLEFVYSNIDKFDERINFIVIGSCSHVINNPRFKYTGYLASEADYAARISNLNAVLVVENQATNGPLNKLLEPMSCAVPVFATPKTMVGLYNVEPGKELHVFEENDIVDRVNKMLFNSSLMAEIGKNGRTAVENYYSKSVNQQKYLAIINSVLDR